MAEKELQTTNLTPKQEKFAQCVVSGMTQADAYRNSFAVREGTKAESIQVSASQLMSDHKVAQRVRELRAPVVAKAQITLETHLDTLAMIRDRALDSNQFSAASTAEIARGKASGLYTDKVEHSGGIAIATIERKIVDPKGK